jgi:hypothetical protein
MPSGWAAEGRGELVTDEEVRERLNAAFALENRAMLRLLFAAGELMTWNRSAESAGIDIRECGRAVFNALRDLKETQDEIGVCARSYRVPVAPSNTKNLQASESQE